MEILYPPATIPAGGTVTVTPVFEENDQTAVSITLNGVSLAEDGSFAASALRPDGNRIALTPENDASLVNLYLDIYPQQ